MILMAEKLKIGQLYLRRASGWFNSQQKAEGGAGHVQRDRVGVVREEARETEEARRLLNNLLSIPSRERTHSAPQENINLFVRDLPP